MKIIAVLSVLAFPLCLVAALISALAPNSLILRWAKLQERRRLYGAVFYFLLSVFFLFLGFLCSVFSWVITFITIFFGIGVSLMWKPLYTGIIPDKNKKRRTKPQINHTHEQEQTKAKPAPIPVSSQQAPQQQEERKSHVEKVLPFQKLANEGNNDINVDTYTSCNATINNRINNNFTDGTKRKIILEQIQWLSGLSDEASTTLLKYCMSNAFDKHDLYSFTPIFEKYFSGIEWTWDEYEFWRMHGNKTGDYPRAFSTHYLCEISTISANNIFNYITLPKAKLSLINNGIELPTKKIKESIINLASTNKNIESLLVDIYVRERQKFIFFLFVQTLCSRFRSYIETTHYIDMEYEYVCFSDADKKLVTIAHKAGFTQYPPFIPGGTDSWRPKFR